MKGFREKFMLVGKGEFIPDPLTPWSRPFLRS